MLFVSKNHTYCPLDFQGKELAHQAFSLRPCQLGGHFYFPTKGDNPLTFNRPMAKEDNMAKVNLTVEAELTASEMRKLNPHLRRKGLTIKQAIDKGLKERIPMMYFNMATFLGAMEGVGLSLDKKKKVA